MTGMGLLGVAAVVSPCHPRLVSKMPLLMCVNIQVVGVMIESVLPVFQSRFGYGCVKQLLRFIFLKQFCLVFSSSILILFAA
jgi:hypothetical protein